ncbi:MAG: hypothetical protein ACT4OV_04515 [Microthrixaceae bacterium]
MGDHKGRFRLSVGVISAAAVAFTVIAGGVATGTPSPPRDALLQSASGEDIFRAIMFLDGPAIGALGAPTAALTPRAQELLGSAADTAVAAIDAADPSFFGPFESDITSGNPNRVEAALERARPYVEDAYQPLAADVPTTENLILVVANFAVATTVAVAVAAVLVVGIANTVAVTSFLATNDPYPPAIWQYTVPGGMCCADVDPDNLMSQEEAIVVLTDALARP